MRILLALLAALAFFGCKLPSTREAEENFVTIHAVDPSGGRSPGLLQLVEGANSKIPLVRLPLITNLDVYHAENYSRDGKVILRFSLTGTGISKWRTASAEYAGSPVALVLGGDFKCRMFFKPYWQGERTVEFETSLSPKGADEICSRIKKNYQALKD
ncbi:MAG: hypothetical protein RL095_3264 [Verrucomicrobiota bacterium]|jgi:hypothetical protein